MKSIEFSIKYAFKDALTKNNITSQSLFDKEDLESISEQIDKISEDIEERRGKGPLAFMDLPYAYDLSYGKTIFGDIFIDARRTILEHAKKIQESGGHYLHLGIGGSALCAITLINALGDQNNKKTPCEIHIPDNIDPDMISLLLSRLDINKTYLNVVSKSGSTVETIATFTVIFDFLKKRGIPHSVLKRRVFVTTDPDGGALNELAKTEGFMILPLPKEVHGRFSVFSPTGLFTAAIGGIDIDELLRGAREADRWTAKAPFWENPAKKLAALHFYGNTYKNFVSLILLPYSDRLKTIADWYSQLVAESLGKKGKGIIPVKALGVTDQHSQLQLYNDGPKDKLIVFFGLKRYQHEIVIPEVVSANSHYDYLKGHSLNDLIDAERRATAASLYFHDVPNCSFMLDELSAFNLGALFTILEKTVCILGELYNINAFDQPGVEESKMYAKAMLGKKGKQYDELREKIRQLEEKRELMN